jgi:hypothetical protein
MMHATIGTAQTFRVFVRNWWRYEYTPFGTQWGMHATARRLVPDPGARKTTLAKRCTEEEARALCQRYADTHKPGPLSRKAEYERE